MPSSSASSVARFPRRRRQLSPATFLVDLVCWTAVFVLLGAPVKERLTRTALLAALVSATWPFSFAQWCDGVAAAVLYAADEAASDDNEGLMKVEKKEGVRASTASNTKAEDGTQCALAGDDQLHVVGVTTEEESQAAVRRRRRHTGDASTSEPPSSSSPAWRELPVSQHELYPTLLLSAALLLGGMFGQLDWQATYQVWPYPSALLYVLARGGLLVTGWCLPVLTLSAGETGAL